MSEPLHVEVSELAAEQIRAAEAWWRLNRPKAPNAIREELERASSLIALQPGIGTRIRNATLVGVRRVLLARIHYDLYLPSRGGREAGGTSSILAHRPRQRSSHMTGRRTPEWSRQRGTDAGAPRLIRKR